MERELPVMTPPATPTLGPNGSRLSDLSRQAEQYRQAARATLARVQARGDTQRSLESLQNISAQ
jgi:hypothetical protein